MTTYLLTGSSGFLGLHIVQHLLARGDTVIGVSYDRAPAPAMKHFMTLPGRLIEMEADLAAAFDFDSIFEKFHPAYVINAAAMTPGHGSNSARAAHVVDVNVISAYALMEAARRANVVRFFQPSSTAVYGELVFAGRAPREDDIPQPDSLYALTKYTVERLALRFGDVTGLPVATGRISALYGRWERDTGVRDLISPQRQVVQRVADGEEVVADPRAARDWTSADDVAAAIVGLLHCGDLPSRLVNISCGESWPFSLWLETLAKYHRLKWRFAEPGEQSNIAYHGPLERPRSPLDVTRLHSLSGVPPARPVQAALDDYAREVLPISGQGRS